MKQKKEINQKLSLVFVIVSIAELAGALGIVAYGLFKGYLSGMTCNLIMSGALALYWLISDVIEPFALHRFDGITEGQKQAYLKYIALDFVGFAGIAYFLFGAGGNTSGSSGGLLGAVVYVVVMKPKRENQQIFYGNIVPEEAGETEAEDAEAEDAKAENGEAEAAEDGEEKTAEQDLTKEA